MDTSPAGASKTLIVLTGATGVGKTSFAIALSESLGGIPILSADSRQLYREIPIGTAAPTAEEQVRVPHSFVGCRSIHEEYSAGRYEIDALARLQQLHAGCPNVILCGGSMLYIQAVCHGIDDIPKADPSVRQMLNDRCRREGLSGILAELKLADPDYYARVDPHNRRRVLHGLEIYLTCGRPLSSYHRHAASERPFRMLRYALTLPRDLLYERIDHRVDEMLSLGLEAEARRLYPHRQLNALNTVGYKELFACFDGQYDLNEAVRLIKRNSRRYARKQLTWQRGHPEFVPIDLSQPWQAALHRIHTDLTTDL